MNQQKNEALIEQQLQDFKRIANERTKDIIADERMVQRVRVAIAEQKPQKARRGVVAYVAAAACVMVMLVSGAILLTPYLNLGQVEQQDHAGVQLFAEPGSQGMATPHPLVAEGGSKTFDGKELGYGIAEVGAFSEGFAPAKATNGLYGYVNGDGLWVIEAQYEEAGQVLNLQATVVKNGAESLVVFPGDAGATIE